jgi:DNA mismatch repair protein MutS2
VRRELRAAQRRIALLSAQPADVTDIGKQLDALEARAAPIEPIAELVPPPLPDGDQVEVGDTVWVADLNAQGEVLVLDGDAAEIQVGSFRVRTRLSSLELRHKAPKQPVETSASRVKLPPAPIISPELHLRGKRVADALPVLEKYLDDAYRSQAPFVRIVHGKGTGKLRQAVHEFLQGNSLVQSFRIGVEGEGDTGVTIVKFSHGS